MTRRARGRHRARVSHSSRSVTVWSSSLHSWVELPGWLDIVEALLRKVHTEGLSGARAVAAVNAIYAYVLVRSQLRDVAATAPRRQLAPVKHNRRRYPLIQANVTEFATARTGKHFALGLDVVTAGLRTALVQ